MCSVSFSTKVKILKLFSWKFANSIWVWQWGHPFYSKMFNIWIKHFWWAGAYAPRSPIGFLDYDIIFLITCSNLIKFGLGQNQYDLYTAKDSIKYNFTKLIRPGFIVCEQAPSVCPMVPREHCTWPHRVSAAPWRCLGSQRSWIQRPSRSWSRLISVTPLVTHHSQKQKTSPLPPLSVRGFAAWFIWLESSDQTAEQSVSCSRLTTNQQSPSTTPWYSASTWPPMSGIG